MGSRGASLEWEWELSTGAHVKAAVDKKAKTESVWLSQRLVSRAPLGSKDEGHLVPLPAGGPYRGEEARVRFDVDAEGRNGCTFTIGEAAQLAVRSPDLALPGRSHAQWAYLALGLVALGLVSAALTGVSRYVAARRALTEINPDAPLALSFPSSDGLLIAHYPAGFEATMATPAGAPYSAVRISREANDVFLGLLSFREPAARDADGLSKLIATGVDKAWMGKGLTVRETARQETTCFGERGIVVEGRLTQRLSEARTWSCTFLRNGRGYYFFYLLPTNGTPEREAMLRRIVEGTELLGEPDTTVASDFGSSSGTLTPTGGGTPSFRFPSTPSRPPTSNVTTSRQATPAPPPRPRPAIQNLPPTPRDTVVCDANGACFGSNQPSGKGVVRGR